MKSLNESSPFLPVSPAILLMFIMYMSQQCIMGQGKLVMVLVPCITVITIMQKLSYMILKFILDNQFENARTYLLNPFRSYGNIGPQLEHAT